MSVTRITITCEAGSAPMDRGWRIRSEVRNVCGTSILEEWLGNLCGKAAGRVLDLPFAGGPNPLEV
jgi:hypothetical protein